MEVYNKRAYLTCRVREGHFEEVASRRNLKDLCGLAGCGLVVVGKHHSEEAACVKDI